MRTIQRPALSLVTLALGLAGCHDESSAPPIESTQAALLGLDADVSVSVTDQVAEVSPGLGTTYRIVVRNAGPLPALAVAVQSVVPANLQQVTWTCTNTAGSGCAASGVGAISETYGMGAGATSTYLVHGVVAASSALGSTMAFGASVRVYSVLGLLLTDSNPANDSATDVDTIVAPAQVPTTFQISGGDAQSGTVGSALAAPFAVIVKDQNGQPIPNVPVAFTSPANGPQLSAAAGYTDAQGKVGVQATLGTTAGSFQVSATSGALAAVSFQVTAKADAPASITPLNGTQQSAALGSALGQPLSVLVKDRYGNPVQNATVSYQTPIALGPNATLSATTAKTNAAGIAAVTATSNATLGVYVISASVAGVLTPVLFTITNVAGQPISLGAAVNQQTTIAGTDFGNPLDFNVLTSGGLPVAGALVSVTSPDGITLDQNQATTDNSGQVHLHAAAGHVAGDYTVNVVVLGGLAPLTYVLHVLPDVPFRLAADATSANQSARIGTPFAQPFGATLFDQYDNRIPNAVIRFDAPIVGPSGSFTPTTATTDAQGHAASTLVAGDLTGTFLATATSPNPLVLTTFSAKATAGAPSAVTPLLALPQSARVTTQYLQPLGVHVQDAKGNAAPGAVVRFQAPAAGASAQLSELVAVTDLFGNAQVAATANQTAGAFTVSAGVDGAMAGVQFSLQNLAGAPASFVADVGSSPQSTFIGTTFAKPLAGAVKDAFGNPVQNALVTFTGPLVGASALGVLPAALSDAQGHVSTPAMANLLVGPYAFTAQAGDAHGSFSLENLATPPGHLTVESGQSQHTPATQPFPQPFVVRFVDADGNPVANTELAIAAPAAGPTASHTPTTVVSDADGRASVQFTAGSTPGSMQIALSAPGAAAPVTATLQADAITTALAASVSEASPAPGAAFTVHVAATASFGSPAGSVQLFDAQTLLGTAELASSKADFTVHLDELGDHPLTARFAAQGSFGQAESPAVTVHVSEPAPPVSSSSSSSGDVGASSSSSSGGSSSTSSSGATGSSSSGGSSSSSSSGATSTSSSSSGSTVSSSSSSGGSTSSGSSSGGISSRPADPGSSGEGGSSSGTVGGSSGAAGSSGGKHGASGASSGSGSSDDGASGGCNTGPQHADFTWLAGLGLAALVGRRRRVA